MTAQRPDIFLLQGGMDTSTPTIGVTPGRARNAVNYEATRQGYRRCDGYERYDGRPAPSDAYFDFLRFSGLVSPIGSSAVLSGATSGAAGTVMAVVEDEAILTDDEYWASSTIVLASDTTRRASLVPTPDVVVDSGYVILRETAGSFVDNETLKINDVTVATSDGPSYRNIAPTVALTATYLDQAAETRRGSIASVPGDGAVRGVAILNDTLYAWRNNYTASACVMYRATASGWVAVDLGSYVGFTAGSLEFQEGETLARATVSAVIRRVVVSSGSWGAGTAAGIMVISDATGIFAPGVGTSASGRATISGPQTTISIPPFVDPTSNTVRTTVYDFGEGDRLYYATGVGRAMEFDGTYTTPIMAPLSSAKDKPTVVAVFANHLFLFYRAGSMLFSGIGDPRSFSTTDGAGEIALGSFPRDAIESASGALMILCRTKIGYLTGTDAESFVFKELSKDGGGWGRSAQNIGRPVYLDQRGLRDISAVDTFANFATATLSDDIASTFGSYNDAEIAPLCSLRSVKKSQYRAYYANGTGVTFFFGRNPASPEPTVFSIPATMTCAVSDASREDSVFSGTERMFSGAKDGFVYQLDKGRSFDGQEIEAVIRLPFNFQKAPHIYKRFHSVDVEIDAAETTKLAISATFNYDDGTRSNTSSADVTSYGNGGYWDEANWDEANYDSPINGSLHLRLDGAGQNIALLFVSKTRTEDPHTLTAARINWSARKYAR